MDGECWTRFWALEIRVDADESPTDTAKKIAGARSAPAMRVQRNEVFASPRSGDYGEILARASF
jgi:hypothetical protein